jgi:chromosomal replication initiation ATPase DnaA
MTNPSIFIAPSRRLPALYFRRACALLDDMHKPITPRTYLHNIIQRICDEDGVPFHYVMGPNRRRETVACRYRCYDAMEREGMSVMAISRLFNKDHSTVSYHLNRSR